jgi:flavin reductase (DIM6/NTAB) family NADH-FMN oxidoreductase RutF/rhodanese-related sulfurtransferase
MKAAGHERTTERMRQMGRRDHSGGTAQLLRDARSRLRRLEPWEAAAALEQWAVLVDIRPAAQRAAEGEVPGALVVERHVLEWRLDPTGPERLPMAHRDLHVIVLDSEGVTSSLAAAALQDVGVQRATDVVGGYQAWRSAGLPTTGGLRPAAPDGQHDSGPATNAFASGVVVVSAVDGDERPIGVAVRSFMALPGDDPVVAVALPSTSRTLQPLLARGQFGVSVLGADQAAVARRFASGLPLGERFQGVSWTPGANGAPLVTDSLSTLSCALVRELAAGDSVVVLGRVLLASGPHLTFGDLSGRPLLYHHGALVAGDDPPEVSPDRTSTTDSA